MCAASSASFRRDERGVSEVIGYVLGFLISFLVLSTSLYGFSIVARNARTLNAHAHMEELANRVALGVQESLLIGTQRKDSSANAESKLFHYERRLTVPTHIEGFTYKVTLDATKVRVEALAEEIVAEVPTFNAGVLLPPVGTCTGAYVVCTISGTVTSGTGLVKVTYEYDGAAVPVLNELEIS